MTYDDGNDHPDKPHEKSVIKILIDVSYHPTNSSEGANNPLKQQLSEALSFVVHGGEKSEGGCGALSPPVFRM